MKLKRKLIAALAASVMLTACGAEEKGETSETQTAPVQTTATAIQTTKAAVKTIKPLSPMKSHAYYQDESFSVTVSLDDLRSSLYYPDAVAEMGINPNMFAVDMTVKVKNISQEEQSFDSSKLALLAGEDTLYMFGAKDEKADDIKSGKTVTLSLKALCSLQQARVISGVSYDGEPLETGENFYPEDFTEIINIQSDENVKTYLYKQFYLRSGDGYHMMACSGPAAISAYFIGRVGENDEYFAIEYSVTNRSDYALLIDPNKYSANFCYDNSDSFDPNTKAVYISTDEELMYKPKEEGAVSGIGTVYALPDFMCTYPDGETRFTVLYSVSGHITEVMLKCGSRDEPCFAEYDSVTIDHCDY